LSKNPSNAKNYYQDFPKITPRDVCQAFDRLRVHLDINDIAMCVGPSLGGQLATEWAIHLGDKLKNLVLIATNAVHSPWGVAFNEAQRMAITADKSWRKRRPDAGLFGMKAARAMAMLSYRHYETYAQKQAHDSSTAIPKAASYQQYQGEKLVQRFNAFSYWALSHMMDAHDVGRGRGGATRALQKISARTLVVGIDSDVLFPTTEQKFLAQHIPKVTYAELKSQHGHDGFLVDEPALLEILQAWV
jgi:homoserine O-acetyltransferase